MLKRDILSSYGLLSDTEKASKPSLSSFKMSSKLMDVAAH